MDVRLPDGTVIQNIPDGTTKADLYAKLKANGYAVDPSWIAEEPKPGVIDKVMAASAELPQAQVADAVLPLLTGSVAAPVAGLAGLAGTVLPGPAGQGAKWVEKTQEALTYQPRTETGKAVTEAVSAPFQALAEVGDAAGGKVAEATGSPALGAAVNTAIQSVPMVLGKVAGKVAPGGELPGTTAARLARETTNLQKDAATANAQAAGYAVPPTQGNPTFANKVIEAFGGKTKTAQVISEKNQNLTNRLAREEFGLAPDVPLDIPTLSGVRRAQSPAYDAVRQSGTITADPVYLQQLDAVAQPYVNASASFPKAKRSAVIDAVNSVKEHQFDAGAAIDQIRILRDDADVAYHAGEKAMGNAFKGIAQALEDQVGRHLQVSGAPPDVLRNFQNARAVIAETYSVQDALRPNGNVDAKVLARQLGRRPLTGNLQTIAEFGANFPKAAQVPERIGGVPMSPLDLAFSVGKATSLPIGAAAGGVAAAGGPIGALAAMLPFARPGARSMMATPAYQQMMVHPTYGRSLLARLIASQEPLPITMSETAAGQRRSNADE